MYLKWIFCSVHSLCVSWLHAYTYDKSLCAKVIESIVYRVHLIAVCVCTHKYSFLIGCRTKKFCPAHNSDWLLNTDALDEC